MKKYFLLFCVCIVSLSCGGNQIANMESSGKNIICFGDSITEGVGVPKKGNYPAILSEMIRRPIINAGVGGDTTRDGLKRLKKDVLNKDPKLVIVEFGANDFFNQIPKEETFKNLDEIVAAIQDQGAIVVIVGVKVGLMRDTYKKGFMQIAKKRKALFVANILRGIITDPKLKIDSIHPNQEGYKIVAKRIYKVIKPLMDEQ